MMKKWGAALTLVALAVCAMTLASCGDDDFDLDNVAESVNPAVVGEWHRYYAKEDEGIEITLKLASNGTFTSSTKDWEGKDVRTCTASGTYTCDSNEGDTSISLSPTKVNGNDEFDDRAYYHSDIDEISFFDGHLTRK